VGIRVHNCWEFFFKEMESFFLRAEILLFTIIHKQMHVVNQILFRCYFESLLAIFSWWWNEDSVCFFLSVWPNIQKVNHSGNARYGDKKISEKNNVGFHRLLDFMRLVKNLLSDTLPIFQFHVKGFRNSTYCRNTDRKFVRHDISRS